MRSLLSALTLVVLSAPAVAAPNVVPEPESLALFGIAAVAGLVVALRKKRK